MSDGAGNEMVLRQLADLGLRRCVRLPSDPPETPFPAGGLTVVRGEDWEVHLLDSGLDQPLVKASNEVAALEYVLQRLSTPLPAETSYSMDELKRAYDFMADVVEPIKQAASTSPGLVVETTLQPGHVLDRIGLVDGIMLYPVGTPLRERSLPPDALDGGGAAGGLHYYGVRSAIPVRARVVEPWFGQPGGGVVFRVQPPDVTIRDLVLGGSLRVLAVADV